jgi:hypothetical protein
VTAPAVPPPATLTVAAAIEGEGDGHDSGDGEDHAEIEGGSEEVVCAGAQPYPRRAGVWHGGSPRVIAHELGAGRAPTARPEHESLA